MKCIMAYENDAGHQDISNQITDMYVTLKESERVCITREVKKITKFL